MNPDAVMESMIRQAVMDKPFKQPRPVKLRVKVARTAAEAAERRELKKARKSQRQSQQVSQRKSRHGRKRGH